MTIITIQVLKVIQESHVISTDKTNSRSGGEHMGNRQFTNKKSAVRYAKRMRKKGFSAYLWYHMGNGIWHVDTTKYRRR